MADGQYTKTNWVNGVTPWSSGNFNNLETQHEEAAYMIGARMQPPIVRWVLPGWYFDALTGIAVAANRIYYTPIYVSESVSYDRIGINVTVGDGAGGLADLRIFEWDTGVPGDLILSAGTVSTNAAAAVEIIIAQSLGPGLYFLAIRCDNTPTISALSNIAAAGMLSAPVSGIATSNAGNQNLALYDDAAYADPAGVVDGALSYAYAGMVRLREA